MLVPSLVVCTMLPLFLGGGVDAWSYSLAFIFMGLVLFLAPPQHGLSPQLNAAFLAMAIVTLAAFLPISWVGTPDWRTAAAEDLGINTGNLISPQPWMSLHGFLALIFILSWLYFLASMRWDHETRRRIMRSVAAVMMIFAITLIVVSLFQIRLPSWNADKGFGPFENRNQTSSVLAMGGVLLFVCAYTDFKRHKTLAGFWVLGVILSLGALIINQSRAGILFFFAGIGIWIGLTTLVRKSLVRTSVTVSFLLLAVTVFFLFGGQALERFSIRQNEDLSTALQQEGRLQIYKDTVSLIRQSPVFGVGLGNFEPSFARNRKHVERWERAVHPESDWLWHTSETGLAGLIATVLLLSLLARKVAPLSGRKAPHGTQLRIGALTCALILALNGILDVPAHRLGSILPALLFLSLAIHHRRGKRPRDSKVVGAFRIAGLIMVATSGLWFIGSTRGSVIPGPIGAENLYAKAIEASTKEDFPEAYRLLSRAIEFRPLHWEYYFLRGKSAAQGAATMEEARKDFRIARFLEPSHAEIPLSEALFWLAQYPPYALPAVNEALHRNTHRIEEYYRTIIGRCQDDETMLRALGRISDNRPDLKLVYLGNVPKPIFEQEVQQILSLDPELSMFTTSARKVLFRQWSQRGNKEELMIRLAQNPTWREAGWELLADFYAQNGDPQAAIVTAMEQLTPPMLPTIVPTNSIESARADFLADHENADPALGIQIYHMEKARGDTESAHAFLKKVAEMPGCPSYVYYLLAEYMTTEKNYEDAWRYMKQFLNSRSPR
ncbi:MAG: O-antigen ligase family protein [Verrucomicrobiota bacterium]